MCGIAGVISGGQLDYNRILPAMVECLRHRGPDDTGYYFDDDIGLGHARLAIMDPQNGVQPTTDETDSIVVIFNGEIFNFRTLRKDLVERGHVLKNNSDTALLPHLYEEHGLGMFARLNGQFAIAIWDKKKRTLVLARDRFGEKPIFYYHKDGTMCFASEAKALFKSELVPAAISPIGLKQVFTFWTTFSDSSIFQDIYQVPPGSYLVFSDSQKKIETYWNQTYSQPRNGKSIDIDMYVNGLEDKLVASVKDRMIADVPIAFYLSGGLDSSLIAGIAARQSGRPLTTFSISFDDSLFDESEYQNFMSRYLGSEHQSIMFSRRQIPSIIKDVIYHAEVPLLRSGAFPMYVLATLVRNNDTKVVLSGEGSDELFGGYDIFREVKIREFCGRQPDAKYRASLYKRVNAFVKGVEAQSASSLSLYHNRSDSDSGLNSHLSRWRLGSYSQQFFAPPYREAMKSYDGPAEMKDYLPADYAGWTPLQQAQYLEVITLFTNYLLSSQGDRVAMASSVECRLPFLDYEVADMAAALPDRIKIRGLNEKYIVKELARKYVPDTITRRKKFPYRAPIDISELMQDEYVRYLTSADTLARFGVFNSGAVDRYLAATLRKDNPSERDAMLFMGILTTQILYEQFIQ